MYKEYVRPQSLEEAYQLNQKQSNLVLAGTLWTKMSHRPRQKGIDLCDLNLNYIEENESEFRIGAFTTLSEAADHEGLAVYTHGAMKEAVRHIVGVQFRNVATIGGSIWGRFGFSDVIALFYALDAEVCLYKKGVLSMDDFLKMSRKERDILTEIRIPKKKDDVVYLSQRNQKVDFPVLNCVVTRTGENYTAVVGARPGIAKKVEIPAACVSAENAEREMASYVQKQLLFGTNMRAGADYRKIICGVLVKRAVLQIKDRIKEASKISG